MTMTRVLAQHHLVPLMAALCLVVMTNVARGQDASQPPSQEPTGRSGAAGSAAGGPSGIDPTLTREFGIQQLLGNLPPGQMDTAPGAGPPQAAGPSRYQYTTLRVVNTSAPRGCGYADWNCMTNLCRSDLGSTAWRGWAGCWRSDGNWICYFDCEQVKDVF
jgi:hypothetical protein